MISHLIWQLAILKFFEILTKLPKTIVCHLSLNRGIIFFQEILHIFFFFVFPLEYTYSYKLTKTYDLAESI